MRFPVFVPAALFLAACFSEPTTPPVVEENVTSALSAILVDDSLGIACFQRTIHSGKTTTVTVEACQASENLPTLASGPLRQTWDAQDTYHQLVIDDANGLLCVRDASSGTFTGCIPQSQVNPSGLAALRTELPG